MEALGDHPHGGPLNDSKSLDVDVLLLVQHGKRDAAFALLLPVFHNKLFRLCMGFMRDKFMAEDALQDGLLRIWRGLERYDGGPLAPWLYTIVRNHCLTLLGRRPEVMVVASCDVDEERYFAGDCGDAELLAQLTDLERLREYVNRLPDRLRIPLTLFYWMDRSTKEVAEMLAIPESNVKTRLFRARRELYEILKRCGLDDPTAWLDTGQ